MFENVRKNKRKTVYIIFGFILIITLIVYYICYALDLDSWFALTIALGFSILSSFGAYYKSDSIILSISHARPATVEENKRLLDILDGLMISSGLPAKPRLYIIDDTQPNAFATGRNPEHAIICVTTGLLEKLEYYELEGVIAHEMAHIKNYDIRLSAVVTVMVGFIVMISDIFIRTFIYSNNKRRSSNSDNTIIHMVLILSGLVFLALAPLIGKIMQMAISRRREFLADSTAIEFTRNPDGLINALIKISSDPNELKVANKATENMYIANPFRNNGKKKKTSLFSTHPSIEDRIEALRNIK